MSTGARSCSASASATERFTTRQSVSTRSGPPTPVSTSTGPAGCMITKPCTGQSRPSGPRKLARCNRLISIRCTAFTRRVPGLITTVAPWGPNRLPRCHTFTGYGRLWTLVASAAADDGAGGRVEDDGGEVRRDVEVEQACSGVQVARGRVERAVDALAAEPVVLDELHHRRGVGEVAADVVD